MANIALNRLEQAQLLDDDWWLGDCDSFESKVFAVLSGQNEVIQGKWCYRFPKTRSKQLSSARNAVADKCLLSRLSDSDDPKGLRKQLVKDISGLGPKQASMFIRNIGRSYDLAIIDTHVLHFMNFKRIFDSKSKKINTVRDYEKVEKIIVNYANEVGYPVGYMDLAIWATMRAASELGL